MDDFLEQVARRKHQGMYTLLYVFLWFIIIVFGMAALSSVMRIIMIDEQGLSINFIALIITVVGGGIAFLAWRRSDYCRLEYDYSFTNGILDVSRVMNNRRRRYLTALDMKDVIRCGPAQGPAFQKTLSEPGLKKHNWFLNRDANLYYFYFVKNNVKHMAVVELHQEMVEMIRSKSYLQKGVWMDENGKASYNYGVSR
jgi:hypothetical protein